MKKLLLVVLLLIAGFSFGQTYHDLSAGTFTQDWSNTGLITTANDWSGVPSIIGYRGDNLTTTTGVDPQTVLADSMRVVNITANATTPSTTTSGGNYEFEITNPVVAFQGSGTADAPFLVFFMNASSVSSIQFSCNLRDIDDAADNAVQPVAFQYRVGTTGNFTNIPSAFVADASTGPSLATLVTPVSFTLPSECDNQPQVQIRVITTNAGGSDEFIGVDDIVIAGTTAGAPTKLAITSINNGIDPFINTGFYAVVQSQDVSNNASAVAADLNYTLTLATGTGVLGGTLTGTILAGTSVDTVFGILYNTAETGVSITATDDAAGLTAGTSATFTVQALPPTAVKLAITDVNGGVDPYVGYTFTATVETWDASDAPVNVVSDVNFSLSALYGTGTLAGTLTGTITAGTNTATVTGLTYDVAENNIALKVVDDASTLIADTSTLFNVLAIPAAPALVITEIMYNSPEIGNDSLEFIEIYNNGSTAVPLKDLYFSLGIVYTFPDDTMQPGDYYVISFDSAYFTNFFGVATREWTSGSLSNSGEALVIKDSFGAIVDSVFYDDVAPWPVAADGTGPSLVLCDPNLDNADGANWFASAEFVANFNDTAVYATPGSGCVITDISNYFDNKSELSCYPNPANGFLMISSENNSSLLEIYDVIGNRVFVLENPSTLLTLNTEEFSKGIYLVRLMNGNKVYTNKISVE